MIFDFFIKRLSNRGRVGHCWPDILLTSNCLDISFLINYEQWVQEFFQVHFFLQFFFQVRRFFSCTFSGTLKLYDRGYTRFFKIRFFSSRIFSPIHWSCVSVSVQEIFPVRLPIHWSFVNLSIYGFFRYIYFSWRTFSPYVNVNLGCFLSI